jgi:hypothetical protein
MELLIQITYHRAEKMHFSIPKHETGTRNHDVFDLLIENLNINALALERDCASYDSRAAARKEMLKQKHVAVRMRADGRREGPMRLGPGSWKASLFPIHFNVPRLSLRPVHPTAHANFVA